MNTVFSKYIIYSYKNVAQFKFYNGEAINKHISRNALFLATPLHFIIQTIKYYARKYRR